MDIRNIKVSNQVENIVQEENRNFPHPQLNSQDGLMKCLSFFSLDIFAFKPGRHPEKSSES